MSENKRQLGISKDVQSKAGIPINAPVELDKRTPMYPNGYEFPIAKLVKVSFDPAKVVKRPEGEENIPVLIFNFVTSTKKAFTEIMFPIDMEDDAFDSKLIELHQKIKHIFEETIGISKFKEENMQGTTFAELFENVAKAFHVDIVVKGEGEDQTTIPVYYNNSIYIKLTYYKDKIQMPKYPNFVQKAFNGAIQLPCELIITPKYDKIKPQTSASSPNAPSNQYTGGQNSTFGADPAFDDFPSV